jgi:hypothetical protein
MHGARDAVANGLTHIEQQVNGIESAIGENPGLAFDLAKTLVESVCRTVLVERSIVFNPNDDLPRLFRMVTTSVPILPIGASAQAETRRSLVRTLNGLHTAIQGICELRNQRGFASHGPGEPRPEMESIQALLAAEAADAIVGFLYGVHRQDRTSSASARAMYDENPEFNTYIDEVHEIIRIFDSEFRPSEVLFDMEPETYRIYLREHSAESQEAETGRE